MVAAAMVRSLHSLAITHRMPFLRSSTGQVLLIFGLIFLQAEWSTPQLNEAHYLAKARHYWQTDWCSGDLFLESADAHLVFYWSIGWLTLFLPMSTVAWIGRIASWLLIAAGLQRMGNRIFTNSPGFTVAASGLFFLLLNRFDLAGEWIIGGFEAKLIAYGCAFFAIAQLLDRPDHEPHIPRNELLPVHGLRRKDTKPTDLVVRL